MLRRAFAVLCGIFAAMIVITFLELAGAKLWPPPPGLDLMHAAPAQLKAFVDSLPITAKILIVAGWLLGAFAGGAVTTAVTRGATHLALVPGVLIAAATVANALSIPHPTWMPATGIVLAVPLAWLGGRLAARLMRKPEPDLTWRGGDR